MDSLTRKRRVVTVAPSPFNAVKVELGLLLVMALPVWLVVGRLVADTGSQLLWLGGYGGAAGLWVVLRARAVVAKSEREQGGRHGA